MTKDVVCTCRRGFSGETCAVQENTCLSEPCQNFGTCMLDNQSSDFKCVCDQGFGGKYCEISKESGCLTAPCSKIGTAKCIELDETSEKEILYKNHSITENFHCKCEPGYTGLFCESDIDECKIKQSGKL